MNLEDWMPLVGESFGVDEAPGLELKLAQAQEQASERLKGQLRAGERIPFSLEFHGPPEPLLPQQLYQLTHSRTGTIGIFLVPVGQEKDWTTYEAIFT